MRLSIYPPGVKKILSITDFFIGTIQTNMGKFENKSAWWSGTQYNLTAFPDQQNDAAQRGWQVRGQLEECPTTKREHYQFAINTGYGPRMSAVMKVFQGAHIEPARKEEALKNYVVKEETRVGQLPPVSNLYPTMDQTLDMFVQYIRDKRQRPNMDDEGFTCHLDGEKWLVLFDEWVNDVAIAKLCLRVETLAVNPATRSAVKRYMNGIFKRHMKEQISKKDETDRQTDRQAEIMSRPPSTTKDDEGDEGTTLDETESQESGEGEDDGGGSTGTGDSCDGSDDDSAQSGD